MESNEFYDWARSYVEKQFDYIKDENTDQLLCAVNYMSHFGCLYDNLGTDNINKILQIRYVTRRNMFMALVVKSLLKHQRLDEAVALGKLFFADLKTFVL